jgi:predicted AAA+ superfamily ATPase
VENLRKKYLRLLGSVDISKKRSLYSRIKWDDRLIIIRGQRGVGKTTLILQHIRETGMDPGEVLYVSLDDIYFSGHALSELVEEFVLEGGKYLYLDEVHRYPGWSQEVKNIYDFYPSLNLVLTGSSALSFYISGADLGRRAVVYHLPELSFREYLYFVHNLTFDIIPLADLLKHHERLALEVNAKVRSVKLFREYLRYGAYPFVLEGREGYPEKVEWLISTVIDNDIPAIENIAYESRMKMKKLLLMMATSSPMRVNLSELSRKVETSRDVLMKFLNLLVQAGIIRLLTTSGVGHTVLRKPDKIYFSNSNMLFSIYENADIGTARETFFLDQLSATHQVTYPKNGDFLVEGKYLFEVGGKNKTFRQIFDHPRPYLAVDDTEYGHKDRIPLWLFGFLY